GAERGAARADPGAGQAGGARPVRPPGPAESAAAVGPEAAEAPPRVLLPALEHHLVDREAVTRPGLQGDPRQKERIALIALEVERRDGLDEPLASRLAARPAERLDRRPRGRHAVDEIDVGE